MLGPLAFLSPWLLGALLALPVIYWLLRTVPPQPQRVEFPPTRILVGVENRDKTPAKTPWWLTLIRMLAATLVILALAEPVLNPNRKTALGAGGPIAIVVDNGWSSSTQWAQRTSLIAELLDEAEALGRPVVIVPTAGSAASPSLKLEAPAAARSTAAALNPQPYAPARAGSAGALERTLTGSAAPRSIVWLTDGLDHDGAASAFAERLAALAVGGKLAVVLPPSGREPLGLAAKLAEQGRLDAIVVRAAGGGARAGILHALSAKGQRLGEATFALTPGADRGIFAFDMPLELRNQVTRIEIAGERSAGAVQLLDARQRWHRVGLISGASREQAQPLLAPLYYIERALAPYAELAKTDDSNLDAAIDGLIKRNISGLVLADIGTLPGELRERVDKWVKGGGVLVRFAGERLDKGGDDLLPVALRRSIRSLGGALSWGEPQPLAPFADDSLFAGLAVPADVTVNRQVLADPARLDANVKVWARLKDGTSLVTASRHGAGQIVLFHVTANSDWSNLPLSGLFVEMLQRVASLGNLDGASNATAETTGAQDGAQKSEAAVLPPLQTLDAFGQLQPPPPTAEALTLARLEAGRPSAESPPGYYGTQGAPRALNIVAPKTVLKSLPALPAGAEIRAYEGTTQQPLKPRLLTWALALLFADIIAVLFLHKGGMGWLQGLRRPAHAAALALLALGVQVVTADGTLAQTPPVDRRFDLQINPDGTLRSPPQLPSQRRVQQPPIGRGNEFRLPPGGNWLPQAKPAERDPGLGALPPAERRAVDATSTVTFGYVLTGDAQTDQTSRQGLIGLGRFLKARTAVEPNDALAVDIGADEIAFLPLLYWPVLANARALPEATLAKIDAYMKQGGMIVFDTRDAGVDLGGLGSGGSQGSALQRLLGNLDIPRLEAVGENHVLTKSFYLMRTFPGRFESGQLWVEAEAAVDSGQGQRLRRVDGVSSILITGNDLAAAWALDDRNQPLYPLVPGGDRQREMAFRTGVNIVMYALTGNYKADQVHIKTLLERLGN